MFISKKAHNKIVKAKEKEITELINKVKRQEKCMKELRRQIEDEHIENYRHHRTLLAIKRLVINFDYRKSNSIQIIRNINNELDNLHMD